jgi:hypothetical protein
MRADKSIKIILVLILILLGLNLLNGHPASQLFYIEAQAKLGDTETQVIDLSNISGITCSADGKYIYVIGHFDDKEEGISNRKCIFRSKNWGAPGSWEMVAKQTIKNF